MSSGTWSARARRAQERAVFGARVALDVLLVATCSAGTWLLALWSIGALVVYQSPAGDPVVASGALEPRLPEASSALAKIDPPLLTRRGPRWDRRSVDSGAGSTRR
jgi:hypothetical protein